MEITPKKSPLQRKRENRKNRPAVSEKDVHELCKKHLSLQEISDSLSISSRSAAIFIERLLKKGYSIVISDFIPCDRLSQIEEYLLSTNQTSIPALIKTASFPLNEAEIRIVRGYLIAQMKDNFS